MTQEVRNAVSSEMFKPHDRDALADSALAQFGDVQQAAYGHDGALMTISNQFPALPAEVAGILAASGQTAPVAETMPAVTMAVPEMAEPAVPAHDAAIAAETGFLDDGKLAYAASDEGSADSAAAAARAQLAATGFTNSFQVRHQSVDLSSIPAEDDSDPIAAAYHAAYLQGIQEHESANVADQPDDLAQDVQDPERLQRIRDAQDYVSKARSDIIAANGGPTTGDAR